MTKVRAEIEKAVPLLQAELRRRRAAATPEEITSIENKANGILLKLSFVHQHRTFLEGVKWKEVYGLGAKDPGAPTGRRELSIVLGDSTVTVQSIPGLILHVYMAFDGLIAGCSNVTDTLPRILNEMYCLGIKPRKANLFEILKAISAPSPLRDFLASPGKLDWLDRNRDLRGRCQHEDIESVLMHGAGAIAKFQIPAVPAIYRWDKVAAHEEIVSYCQRSITVAEDLLFDLLQIVCVNPALAVP